MSSTRWRSSSRSRTTIGYSLPPWRKNAACVPPTLVRMLLATLLTDRPRSAAFGRSICRASSGRPSSRPTRALRTSRHAVHHGLGRDGEPLRLGEIVAADLERDAAVAAAAVSRRVICWLPPDARVVMMAPGMMPASCLFSAAGDLFARAGALGLGHEADRDLRAVGAAAAEAAAARARLRDERVGFLHVLRESATRAERPHPARARCACRRAVRP